MFLYSYRIHDYENALVEANRSKLHGTFQGPANRVPVLGQLGRIEEAKKEFDKLLKLRPDFIGRGKYLLKIHIKEDTLVEHLLEGFEKMGVHIE